MRIASTAAAALLGLAISAAPAARAGDAEIRIEFFGIYDGRPAATIAASPVATAEFDAGFTIDGQTYYIRWSDMEPLLALDADHFRVMIADADPPPPPPTRVTIQGVKVAQGYYLRAPTRVDIRARFTLDECVAHCLEKDGMGHAFAGVCYGFSYGPSSQGDILCETFGPMGEMDVIRRPGVWTGIARPGFLGRPPEPCPQCPSGRFE